MPPVSGIHSLPEELLSWILAIHFARIPEVFCRTLSRPRKSPLPVNPPSVALLVSQKWRRVGTPHLYRFLSILEKLLRRIYAGSKNKRVVYHSPDDPWAVNRFMLLPDIPSDVKKLLQRAEDYPEED